MFSLFSSRSLVWLLIHLCLFLTLWIEPPILYMMVWQLAYVFSIHVHFSVMELESSWIMIGLEWHLFSLKIGFDNYWELLLQQAIQSKLSKKKNKLFEVIVMIVNSYCACLTRHAMPPLPFYILLGHLSNHLII